MGGGVNGDGGLSEVVVCGGMWRVGVSCGVRLARGFLGGRW